jgi:uncharacterized protein
MARFLPVRLFLMASLLLALVLTTITSLLAIDFPQPTGFINDFAGTFSPEFTVSLEQDLSDFEKETTAEIAVVTVESLQETTIEDYAVRLFENWEIGKEKEDNGLLVLIAPNERQIRIEVGYGLEPVINDSRAGRIIRDQITPEFKEGNYEIGIKQGVEQIKAYIRSGEPPSSAESVGETVSSNLGGLILGFFILVYLSSFWGRSKRVWPGGVVGAILGLILGLLLGAIIWKLLLPVFFGLFGFLLDLVLSRNYKKLKKQGRPTGFWRTKGGFFSGRSSSGGGGFGGFGGGSSGGGGASGSW